MDNTNTNSAPPEEPQQVASDQISQSDMTQLNQLESETKEVHPFRPNFDISSVYPTPVKSGVGAPATGHYEYANRASAAVEVMSAKPQSTWLPKLLGMVFIPLPFVPAIALVVMYAQYLGFDSMIKTVSSLVLNFGGLAVNSFAVAYILIGIGIMMRKDFARMAAIIIIIVSLVSSGIGYISAATKKASAYDGTTSTQAFSSDAASGASAVQARDQAMSASTNTRSTYASDSSNSLKNMLSILSALDIAVFVTNIVLLILLTRPAIRSQFD